jgi:hypothetical protein
MADALPGAADFIISGGVLLEAYPDGVGHKNSHESFTLRG